MPCHNKHAAIITRKEVGDNLMRMFLLIKERPPFMHFSLIIGPSGSGKTHAVREFCNKFLEVLYYEIGEPCLCLTSQ